MKILDNYKKEIELKYLEVQAYPRYWEDSKINGIHDDEEGTQIPCKKDDMWYLNIEIDTGLITNWEKGKTANIHYKVCDAGYYYIKDINGNDVLEKIGYVPDILSPKEEGFGDYIIMDINEKGYIQDWKINLKGFKDI